MTTATLPAGACGACPSVAGHYCRDCWQSLAADGRLRCVLEWRGAKRRPTPDAPSATSAVEPAPRPATTSRYVCREHHTPVTWRGRGCTECTPQQEAASQ